MFAATGCLPRPVIVRLIVLSADCCSHVFIPQSSHETKLYRMNLLDNPTTLKLVHNLACGEGPSRLGHLQIDSERRAGFTRGQITIMQRFQSSGAPYRTSTQHDSITDLHRTLYSPDSQGQH
ncbi:hypothetical protein RRG08_049137 [Elysia crispata]|uniref:Uncharacterized protein n=1 Tax=Elysia crispata TaxID=231223 RepID=A0AAE1DPJ4_9GAST|nr:hypothetical protein RRG08_049137 [Elysia crispata]